MSPRRMPEDCPLPVVVSATTVEEARAGVVRLLGDHDLALDLDRDVNPDLRGSASDARLRMALRSLDLGPCVALSALTYHAAVRLDVPSGVDRYLVMIPLDGRIQLRHGAREATAHRRLGVVAHPGEPLHMRWSAGCPVFTIGATQAAVNARYRAWTGEEPQDAIRFDLAADLTMPIRRVLRGIRHLLDLLHHYPDLTDQAWFLADAGGWVTDGLLYAQPHTHRHHLSAELPAAPPPVEFPGRPHLPIDPEIVSLADPARRQPMIQYLRKELGIAQAELAQRASARRGVHLARTRLSAFENEKRLVDAPWIPHLAAELRTPQHVLEEAVKRTKIWLDLHKPHRP